MKANDLFNELHSRGATLSVADGRLRITAPKGTLTQDLRQTLIQRKPELVTWHNAQAREILDAFFAQEVVPRLSALHRAGKLPDLADDPAWLEVEKAWDKASIHSKEPCDVEQVKRLMGKAVSLWEKPDPVSDLG